MNGFEVTLSALRDSGFGLDVASDDVAEAAAGVGSMRVVPETLGGALGVLPGAVLFARAVAGFAEEQSAALVAGATWLSDTADAVRRAAGGYERTEDAVVAVLDDAVGV